MRCVLLVPVMLLVFQSVTRAEDKYPFKGNRLKTDEIAEGWVLLFDGETTFGWEIDGDAKVRDGVLVLGGPKPTKARVTTLPRDDFRLYLESSGTGQLIFEFGSDEYPIDLAAIVELRARPGKVFDLLGNPTGGDGRRLRRDLFLTYPQKSRIGLHFDVPAGKQAEIRSLRIRPHEFVGWGYSADKDMSGWREFPGRKSKFTVTPDHLLHVKDGPGDLQTKKKWCDFWLQLDCRTNGDGLNSGVFFRCMPNEYQNGYEAQIHNGFTEPPGKEYVLDVYDPVSHELKEKKKVRYTAVDYGTGAIYRRQPARKQMAKDREWFTMSIVAQGRHFGVWVNGVQVTAWTDNRPAHDNPRIGYREAAGHISLQGHDPTTDLHFRRILITQHPGWAEE